MLDWFFSWYDWSLDMYFSCVWKKLIEVGMFCDCLVMVYGKGYWFLWKINFYGGYGLLLGWV